MGANDGRAMGCWFAYEVAADALSTDCFAGASATKMRITGALTGGQLLPCSTSTHTRR